MQNKLLVFHKCLNFVHYFTNWVKVARFENLIWEIARMLISSRNSVYLTHNTSHYLWTFLFYNMVWFLKKIRRNLIRLEWILFDMIGWIGFLLLGWHWLNWHRVHPLKYPYSSFSRVFCPLICVLTPISDMMLNTEPSWKLRWRKFIILVKFSLRSSNLN